MAEWLYSPEDYARTRRVIVAGVTEDGGEAAPDSDGQLRWVRQRTGDAGATVSQSKSEGFPADSIKWCYRNAVKENYPIVVPVPAGVEKLEVTTAEDLELEPEEQNV